MNYRQYIIEYDDVEGSVYLLGLEEETPTGRTGAVDAWVEILNETDIACPESYAWGMYDTYTKRFDTKNIEVVNVNQ